MLVVKLGLLLVADTCAHDVRSSQFEHIVPRTPLSPRS